MASDDKENPEFEQLDDLFDEDLSESDPLAEADADGAALDLEDLTEDGAIEGLDDTPNDALEDVPDDDQLTADLEDGTEDEDGKSKKKKKKRKEKKKRLRKKDSRPKDTGKDKKKGRSLVGLVASTDVFAVMLGLALLAIVIAVACLWMELRGYDYKIKATRPVVMAPNAEFAPDDAGLGSPLRHGVHTV